MIVGWCNFSLLQVLFDRWKMIVVRSPEAPNSGLSLFPIP